MSPSLRFIRQDVQSMHAYAIQHSVGMVKLDAMENPFTLPAALQAELGQRLGRVEINRYPGARIDALKAALDSGQGGCCSVHQLSSLHRKSFQAGRKAC